MTVKTTDDDDLSPESTNKQSKRDRFKGALTRTKSKFKKNNDKERETAFPDDVNDFLAAGRTSTSSLNSAGDALPHHPIVTTIDEQSTSASSASPRPSTSDSFAQNPNPFASPRSPRKIPIPKIDVSNAQRWPRAQPVGTKEQELNDFLRPEYQGRSQSVSSFSGKSNLKQGGRGRGLSVSFLEAPPVIIGEGGDDAPNPPVEIGKARQRARSASPMPNRNQAHPESTMNGTYEKRPSPLPPPPRHHALPDALRPRMLQRIQTGGADVPMGISSLNKEFEMTLRKGPNAVSPDSTGTSTQNSPEIIAPKPIRVVQPPSVFEEPIEPSGVREGVGSTNLREKFKMYPQGISFRERQTPGTVDGMREGRSLRRFTSLDTQEPPA